MIRFEKAFFIEFDISVVLLPRDLVTRNDVMNIEDLLIIELSLEINSS